jgi:hypothetical protein
MSKSTLRLQLQADVAAALLRGVTVTRVPVGVYSDRAHFLAVDLRAAERAAEAWERARYEALEPRYAEQDHSDFEWEPYPTRQ